MFKKISNAQHQVGTAHHGHLLPSAAGEVGQRLSLHLSFLVPSLSCFINFFYLRF